MNSERKSNSRIGGVDSVRYCIFSNSGSVYYRVLTLSVIGEIFG